MLFKLGLQDFRRYNNEALYLGIVQHQDMLHAQFGAKQHLLKCNSFYFDLQENFSKFHTSFIFEIRKT